jgi:hypothetical protein
MEISIIGPSAQAKSRNVQSDRRVNLYAEQAENRTLSLYPRPGLLTWVSIGTGPIRGQIAAGGYLWAVSGTELYRVTTGGTATLVGTVLGSGAVAMAENGTQIMIGCGASRGYVVTRATPAVAQITDPDFVGADWLDFLDGYFLFGLSTSAQFYGTALYDATSIDALDFASAEGSPGNIVTGIVDHRELMLFKALSMEGHRNTGAAGFPIERIEGAFMEHGCAAGRSVVKIDNSVFFLGQDDKGQGMVWRIEGYSPSRISNHGIEEAISQWPDMSDAYAWAYQDKGHTYYVLSSVSGNQTWAYDCAAQQWTQWAWRDPADNSQNRHRGANHAFFGGMHIVGDHTTGTLYQMTDTVATDDGDPISQIFEFQVPRKENKRIFMGRLELVCETGVGLTTGQGSDPQAMMQISRDGGHTWGNERWCSLGAIGRYLARVYWNRCGQGRQLVVRIVVTDPVPTAWIGIVADIEAGES